MQTIHGVGKSTQQVKISAWYIFQVCVRNFWLPLLTSEHKYLNCLLLTFSKQALTTFHQITSLISTYQWTSRTADVARRKMCVVTNIQLHLALQKWLLGILYFWVHFKLYHSLSKESESVLLLLPESLENGKYSSKLINTVNTSYTQRHMWRFWLWSCPVAVWIVSWAELSAPENIKVAIKLSTSKTKTKKKAASQIKCSWFTNKNESFSDRLSAAASRHESLFWVAVTHRVCFLDPPRPAAASIVKCKLCSQDLFEHTNL